MKKIILILSVLALYACGGGSGGGSDPIVYDSFPTDINLWEKYAVSGYYYPTGDYVTGGEDDGILYLVWENVTQVDYNALVLEYGDVGGAQLIDPQGPYTMDADMFNELGISPSDAEGQYYIYDDERRIAIIIYANNSFTYKGIDVEPGYLLFMLGWY